MEQTTSSSSSGWIQEAAKKGLILGIIHIAVFVLLYYLFPNKLAGLSYVAFIIVLNLVYMISQGRQWRNENFGGYVSYGNAFKYLFVLLAVNGLLAALFNLLFLLIEPNLPEVMADAQLNVSLYWASFFGAPEESLDQMREQFNREDVTNKFGVVGSLIGIGFGLLLWAVGAAIAALFVKKNVPETI
jgi:hypothetical protein